MVLTWFYIVFTMFSDGLSLFYHGFEGFGAPFGSALGLRIGFENFLRAYEASLRTERLRAVGDLECAFRYFAGSEESVGRETLLTAFREITPISFSDAEVREMIDRVTKVESGQESVHLRDFCEVVCKATFISREGREQMVAQTPKHRRLSMQTRMGTKEIGDRLGLLQKAVSGKGLQIEYSPESDPGGAPDERGSFRGEKRFFEE